MDLQFYSSAIRPILRSLLTKLLVALGVWLAAHGYLTAQPVAGDVDPIAQEIVGWLLALASALYAAYKAKHVNDKAVAAATSTPGDGKTIVVDGEVVNHA